MSLPHSSCPDGESLKRAAHALLERHRKAIIRQARRALLLHLFEHGTGTMDDVRDVVAVPAGMNPKLFGTVPTELARDGILVRDGFAKSNRRAAHARHLSQWQIADPAKAAAWLAANAADPVALPSLFDSAAAEPLD